VARAPNAAKRAFLVGLGLAFAAAGCSGSLTASEYVEGLNVIASDANSLFEPVVASYNEISVPTIEDDTAFLREEIAIRRRLNDPLNALEPPEFLVDIHAQILRMSTWQLTAAEALLPVAEASSSFEEMSRSAQFADYEAANGFGSEVCVEVQGQFDDLADKEEAFADVPWISDQLSVAVRAVLGCGDFEKA
jgi:hypothetical protein